MDNNCIDLENVPNADEKCPWCGAEVDGYDDLDFVHYNNGCGIEVRCYCPECEKEYALVYHLGEAVGFDD